MTTSPTPATGSAVRRELEIKLGGAPEIIERALRSEVIRSVLQNRPRTRQLESVYFDTPDARLQRQGVGLRLRKQGRKWIQTLKRERDVVSGLHDRDELEHVVGLCWPRFALYDQTPFEELFADPDLRNQIQPLFSTAFRRTTRDLRVGDALIELAYDRGTIEANTRHASLCELELELKTGDGNALFALARGICGEFPLRLDNRSKAERGYALALGYSPRPGKARAVALAPAQNCSEAFVAVASECLRHLQANENGVLEGKDPEYVHQARVALRRLRAAFSLFRPVVDCEALRKLDADLRYLAQALGVARDWDVFCLETLPALPPELNVGTGIEVLSSQAVTRRRQANEFARSVVSNSQFTLLMLEMGSALQRRAWTSSPSSLDAAPAPVQDIAHHARAALARSWRRALKRAKIMDAAQPHSFHPIRIALKKVRYGGEYFAALFPRKSTRQFLDALTDIQESLGRVNDAATASRLVDTLREERHDPDAREMLGALRGYFAGRMPAAMRPVAKGWTRLKRTDAFWS